VVRCERVHRLGERGAALMTADVLDHRVREDQVEAVLRQFARRRAGVSGDRADPVQAQVVELALLRLGHPRDVQEDDLARADRRLQPGPGLAAQVHHAHLVQVREALEQATEAAVARQPAGRAVPLSGEQAGELRSGCSARAHGARRLSQSAERLHGRRLGKQTHGL